MMQSPLVPLTFRPTRLSDLAFVMQTERHPDNARFINQWRQDQHEAAIVSGDAGHWIVDYAGKPAGYFILEGLQSQHETILLRRIVILDKGKGYGRQCLQWIKRYVFHELRFHRLWLDVVRTNERAQALYLSEGFEVEGCLRDAYKQGGHYEDMLVLGLLTSDYP